MLTWLKRYWMPTSMTFWVGIFLILSGIIFNLAMVTGNDTGMIILILDIIWNVIPPEISGLPPGTHLNISPNVYVVAGLALIGLRRSQQPSS